MTLNQKKGYYDALIDWCDAWCSNTHVLMHPDGTLHCHYEGIQIDLQNVKGSRVCLKCPYNTDWKWKLKQFGGK
ncbi:hypothetical protein KAR91_45940 [Candidatus Pacearchaeota archaeon]|nr:hypothetical protein [Candidatus Pacearchaeota archaeon]